MDISTGEAQVVAAVGLIAVSIVTAGFARAAVREAERTRTDAARPALGLDLVTVGGLYVEVGIVNVGRGAALDLDLALSFIPSNGARDPQRYEWAWPMIRPGQSHQLAPPAVDGERRPDLEKWASLYPRVELTGTVRDRLDARHPVSVTIEDVTALRERSMAAGLAGGRETVHERRVGTIAEAAGEVSARLSELVKAIRQRP